MVLEPIKWLLYGGLCGEKMSDENKHAQPGEEEERTDHTDHASITGDQDAAARRKAHCLFSGSYSHGVDAKGRMIIPAAFRDVLGERFVVAPTPDFQAIALYPTAEWIAQQDRLEALTALDARAQRLIDHFNKYSYTDSETDTQGRLLLPQKMRSKYLGASRDVEVSGAKTYIRIVSEEAGQMEDEAFERDFPDPLQFMAQLQNQSRVK